MIGVVVFRLLGYSLDGQQIFEVLIEIEIGINREFSVIHFMNEMNI